jgi:uncharacterized protein (TIGR00156 family)
MLNKFIYGLTFIGILLGCNPAFSADTPSEDKPISKVTDINSMQGNSVVYIQGYLIQNLGNNTYVFQDASGTINIEIDQDLINGNTITPDAVVWIVATVDKEGDITSLDAEEIVFLPADNE